MEAVAVVYTMAMATPQSKTASATYTALLDSFIRSHSFCVAAESVFKDSSWWLLDCDGIHRGREYKKKDLGEEYELSWTKTCRVNT